MRERDKKHLARGKSLVLELIGSNNLETLKAHSIAARLGDLNNVQVIFKIFSGHSIKITYRHRETLFDVEFMKGGFIASFKELEHSQILSAIREFTNADLEDLI
jgi:hypothetical protein